MNHRYRTTKLAALLLALMTGLSLFALAASASHNPDECAPNNDERISATAHDDGSITLTWDHYGERSYEIERREAGGDWEHVAHVASADTWTDTNTTEGVTYEYQVESTPGPRGIRYLPLCVEVTAIPFFGAPLVAALAALGSVGAYALYRGRA